MGDPNFLLNASAAVAASKANPKDRNVYRPSVPGLVEKRVLTVGDETPEGWFNTQAEALANWQTHGRRKVWRAISASGCEKQLIAVPDPTPKGWFDTTDEALAAWKEPKIRREVANPSV